jgi:hypothetical protein
MRSSLDSLSVISSLDGRSSSCTESTCIGSSTSDDERFIRLAPRAIAETRPSGSTSMVTTASASW